MFPSSITLSFSKLLESWGRRLLSYADLGNEEKSQSFLRQETRETLEESFLLENKTERLNSLVFLLNPALLLFPYLTLC